MAAVGQAQANASLIEELFREHPLAQGSRVWFAGAGTGQMFRYMDAAMLAPYAALFTDINPVYLDRLAARYPGANTLVDDLEESKVEGPFDLAIAVLVLEHVDWRRALACMAARARGLFVVMQVDSAETPAGELRGSMRLLERAPSALLNRDELITALADLRFVLDRESARDVPNGKRMLALHFTAVAEPDRGSACRSN